MSFFDVHVNWAPVSGTVSFYRYHRGSYLAAWHSKSSTKNERTTIVFKNEDGTEVLCRQIAGLFARRVPAGWSATQNTTRSSRPDSR